MYGLNAIAAHNGWAMAFAGAMIVFSGLIILSLAISQLHKIVKLLEKRESASDIDIAAAIAASEAAAVPFGDLAGLCNDYGPLAAELGETFQLSDLFALAQAKGMPHIHHSIKTLREGLFLIPRGDGVFEWQAGDNE